MGQSFSRTGRLRGETARGPFRARIGRRDDHGGGGGIRTHEALAGLPVFKTGAFDRSATPPAVIHDDTTQHASGGTAISRGGRCAGPGKAGGRAGHGARGALSGAPPDIPRRPDRLDAARSSRDRDSIIRSPGGRADLILSCGDISDQLILEAAKAHSCEVIFAA